MKKFKLLFLLVLMVAVVAVVDTVNAANIVSGNTYEYTVTRKDKTGEDIPISDSTRGYVIFDLQGMRGTCMELGVAADHDGRGQAVITSVPSDDLLAKVLYYMVVVKNYADLSNISSKNFEFFFRAVQYIEKPNEVLEKLRESEDITTEDIDNFLAMIEEARNVQVPSSFVVYKGVPTNDSQDFAVWEIKPFEAKKTYASDTPSGKDHAAVKAGDTIKYDISWENGSGTMTITDKISKGLSYVKGSANLGEPTITKNKDGSTTLVWTTKEVTGKLTYSAKVTNDPCGLQINKVQNDASMTVENKPYVLAELENPLPSKCYAPEPNDGYNHKKVQVGNNIKYQITLTNVKSTPVKVVVTDIFSKGLTYNSDASVVGGTLTNAASPVVNSDKSTKLEFTITVPAKSVAVLTYSGKVNSEAVTKVINNASAQYENEPSIHLNRLDNPIYTPKKVVPIPDTGSSIAILGIASGIALVGVGGYFIFKKYKKA